MSVVVVGGNECMVTRYKQICSSYNCKSKVFTHMTVNFEQKIGSPDLVVVSPTPVPIRWWSVWITRPVSRISGWQKYIAPVQAH